MPLEIHVDRSACRGSMSCMRRAPGTFSLDREKKSVVAEAPREAESVIREAARACPFFAIAVKQGDRG